MAIKQGSTFDGPILIREGGLVYQDYNEGPRKVEQRFYRVTVSSAEILALNATPKTLVAAPGAGKVLEFVSATLFFDATATAYAGIAAGEDLAIRFTDGSGAIASTTLEVTGLLDQTSDQIRTFKPITTDLTPVVNSPLVLHMLTGEITTGTGVIYLDVIVNIHETGL
jgi:hypothetical protein